jgi:hypothetical protein
MSLEEEVRSLAGDLKHWKDIKIKDVNTKILMSAYEGNKRFIPLTMH